MFKWLRKKINKEPVIQAPKCTRCGLRAIYEMNTSILDNEEEIDFRLCDSCLEEYNALYNSRWIPPPIKKEEKI